jgi:hypothetical protein
LHNGLLTGKFSRSEQPADTRIMRQRRHIVENAPWDVLDRYRDFAEARGITMLEATFGWLLAQPALASVIAGTTRPEQIRQNAAAGERVAAQRRRGRRDLGAVRGSLTRPRQGRRADGSSSVLDRNRSADAAGGTLSA